MPPARNRVSQAAEEPLEEETPEQTLEEDLDSSQASSAATEPTPSGSFFEDTGPEFDGEQVPDEERSSYGISPDKAELLDLEWDPKVVASLLEGMGLGLHTLAGKGETDWIFVKRELNAIAPPLARILSRYPVTAAAAGQGDELAVLLGLGGYTARSIKERSKAIADAKAAAGDDTGKPSAGTPAAAFTPAPDAGVLYEQAEEHLGS